MSATPYVPLVARAVASSSGAGATSYLVPLDVGTPAQRLHLLLATAHSGLLLPTECSDPFVCYNASASTTLERDLPTWTSAPTTTSQWGDDGTATYTWTEFVGLASERADDSAAPAPPPPSSRVDVTLRADPARIAPGRVASGTLGAADGPWAELVAPFGAAFALDLHAHTSAQPSRLLLGPFNGSAAGSRAVQWSYQQLRPPFGLTLFRPSVCGASLLGDSVSALWPATIDTAEPCLVLSLIHI